MSHATQLHGQGYLANPMPIMHRCSLPGNVQDKVTRSGALGSRFTGVRARSSTAHREGGASQPLQGSPDAQASPGVCRLGQ